MSYGIQTWHDSRLMHVIYAYAHVDDLELDGAAGSQWLGRVKNSALNYLNKKVRNNN